MNLILLNETKNLYQTKNVFNLTAKSMKYSTTTKKKTPQKSQNEFNYCLQAVKTTDYNCYLSTLLVPENLIRPAFAIKALNYELMSIKKSNQDPRISQIKLTFWKEQLDKIFKISNSVKNNKEIESSMLLRLQEPISNEILQVVKNYNLSKSWFNRLIDGRKSFLATDQFKNMDELERYGDAQMASIYYILLNCMKVNNNIDCDHVASHLGKSLMICKVVKNMLNSKNQSVYYIPLELLIKHKISQQDLINLNEKVLRPKEQNLKDLSFELCTRANQHLNSARDLGNKVPKEVRPIFASTFECEVFLSKMEKYDFDLFSQNINSDFRFSLNLKLISAKLINKL